MLLLSKLTIAI